MEKLIAKLKQIAKDNYNNGGDGMVECWDDREYIKFINRCKEFGEDVEEEFYKSMAVYKSHREDIEGTAF